MADAHAMVSSTSCLLFQVILVHHSFAQDHTVAFLSARGQQTSKHLSHHVKVQVTCTRLGSDRATSHVSIIVFAISLSGDFLVVFHIMTLHVKTHTAGICGMQRQQQ